MIDQGTGKVLAPLQSPTPPPNATYDPVRARQRTGPGSRLASSGCLGWALQGDEAGQQAERWANHWVQAERSSPVSAFVVRMAVLMRVRGLESGSGPSREGE